MAHVLLHPDWEQKKTRNGKRLMVNEKTIERINVFNPDPDIVLEQIENAGGIDSYKGRFCGRARRTVYLSDRQLRFSHHGDFDR